MSAATSAAGSRRALRDADGLVAGRLALRRRRDVVGLDRGPGEEPRPERPVVGQSAERLAQEADDPRVHRDDRHAEPARAERRAGQALGVARLARDRGGGAEGLARGGLVAAAQEGLAADEEHVGAQRAAAGVERLEGGRRGGGGVLVGELRHAVARGAERDVDRGRRVAARRGREPVGRELAEARRVVPVERLERVGDRAVQPHAPGEAQLLVDRLADERVGEAVAAGPRAVLADELRCGRLLDGLEDVDARERVEALEQGEVEVAPDDGGGLQRAVRAVAQARQAAAEHLAHALRDPRARARLAEVADDLLEEERVARGLLVERGRELVGAEPAAHELRDVARLEPGERDALVEPLAAEVAERGGERMGARELALAVGADDEQRGGPRRADEVREEQQRALVGPVEVVEREHGRRAGAQRGVDGLEEAPARALRVVARDRRVVEPRVAERLDERLVGRDRLLEAAAGADLRAAGMGRRAELGHEARLADAGLAADQDEAALAGARAVQGGREPGERGVAADERAAGAADDAREAGRRAGGAARLGGARLLRRPDLRGERPRLGRRRDPEPRAQPVAQALVGRERGGPVAGGREAADERPPPLLGVRVERDLLAAQPDGRGAVAARLGRVGERAQPRRQTLAVRVALGQHPVLLEPGQQLAVAERERLLGPARREQRLDLARVDPRRVERDRVAVGDEADARRAERAAELVERRAQARPGARVEDVGPEPRRDGRARVAAGMQREEAEQLAGAAARRRVERGPVGLEGEAPEHAHAEHRDATLTLR